MPTVPKYVRVINAIRDQIKTGQLKPGDQLPNTEELLALYQVGYGTLRTALMELMRDGWIEGRQGEGRFVTLNPPFGGV